MGLVSWLGSDNGFMSDGMLKDMIIGGLGGILSAPLGEWIAGSKLATWIASKINISWLQSAFPRIFGGSVAAGADQGIMDFLSSGKFNWKNLLVAMALGGSVVGGGAYITSHADDIVKGINSIDISFATELFADGTTTAPKTLGDTDLGQWLQKFASGSESGTFIKGGNESFSKTLLESKPKNSPVPKKWLDKGGSIYVDENRVWTYTNKDGVSIRYPDGYPDFSRYQHPVVAPVKIQFASPTNRPKDFREANIKANLNKDSDPPAPVMNQSPPGYTWHHHQDGETMMLVDRKIHDEFKHRGGVSVKQEE